MAELLTTDKLSELACVTLYMMYEKMTARGADGTTTSKSLTGAD